MATAPASPTASSVGASATLKSAHVWEVSSPLPITPEGKGHRFLPSGLTPSRRRRRVNVEVHRVKSIFESAVAGVAGGVDPLDDTEICYVRILEPQRKVLERIAEHTKEDGKKIKKGAVNFLARRKEGDAYDSDDSNGDDGTVMDSFREPIVPVAEENERNSQWDGWVPKYKISLRMFHIVERKKRSAIVAFEARGRSAHREFVFDDETAVSEFIATIETNKQLLEGRAKTRLEFALGDIKLRNNEQLALLFDVCSGSNLPRSDIGRDSDPYVSVWFDGRKVHKTGFVSHESDPIWTLRKGSLFVWRISALELFQSEEGLIFEVRDYDAVGSNESLGAFNINARTLYEWNGERREFALKPLLGQKDFGKGTIALRVRRATENDIRFMEKFHEEKRKGSTVTFPTMSVPSPTALKSMLTVNSKKEKEGPDKGKTKYCIRPGPDPKRIEETSWLTQEKIEEETAKPSFHWTDIGSGSLGKIFVEVLGCDNLPNMDLGGTRDKTDAFVSLVYEDSLGKTDVIADCLSPRWMPWTRRAYIFNMTHTSSQLFLGVFDSDVNALSSHDLVGRVSIDLSNFRQSTLYELHYKLYPTAQATRESKYGTIKIRLRLELEDERTLLLSNFRLPQDVYVNVDNKKDYEVIKQTVEGNLDMKRYNPTTIVTFIGELLEFFTIVYFLLEDTFLSLILWRGLSTFSLPMPSYSTRSVTWVAVEFPIHSLVAFVCVINLVENPDLLPSLFFLCIGWLLLAKEEWRIQNTNQWMHCKTFSQFLSALILGRSVMGPQLIEPHENSDAEENTWDKRIKEAEKKVRKRAAKYAREQAKYLKEMDEIGETNEELDAQNRRSFPTISLPTVSVAGFPVAAKMYLFPIQQYLRIACIWLRVLRNIVVWEECYISFWIAITSFLLSMVVLFIPWGFLIKWTIRIVAWVAFGPWMKLADKFYFSHLTDEEETDDKNLERESGRKKWLDEQKLEAQIARERTLKLRDFKQHMFGEHICRVNELKKDRYYDLPLPTSSATIYKPGSKSLGELAMQEAGYHRSRVSGQQLVGEMIPTVIETPPTEAPTGKPAKKTDLLSDKGLLYNTTDSYSAAAIKVGSIVVGAGVITWFGVPLFVFFVRLLLPE